MGHYVAAKATGMRVERFFLFFGPTLWSFKRGETEYGMKAIPLGGYVKITGMNPEEEVPPEDEHRAYYRQKVWKRIVVVAAGPAVNIALAFAILFVVYFANAQQVEQKVGEISTGSPAAKVLQPGDRILAVDGESYPGLETEERLRTLRRRGRLPRVRRQAGRGLRGHEPGGAEDRARRRRCGRSWSSPSTTRQPNAP